MLSLLIVALVLNCEPAFPPAGSGLLGFVLALDFLKALPLVSRAYLAAMYFLFFSLRPARLTDDFGMFLL